ncbi:MAG: response regulator transcription factor [Prolixibacteraceae bacterium]|nr:response regulator transcription factor [Prolixibacteraceae bacterium]
MNTEQKKISVHIADPEKMLAGALRDLIDKSGFAEVSHISHTLAECREALAKRKPDVLLLEIRQSNNKIMNVLPQTVGDRTKILPNNMVEVQLKGVGKKKTIGYIRLPEGNGIDFCTEIKRKYPYVKIIILTGQSDWITIRHLLNRKAAGYIMKTCAADEVLDGIRNVAEGKVYVCSESQKTLKQGIDDDFIMIPVRQGQVLLLMAGGYTNEEIAELMGVQASTVIKYRKILHYKLMSDGRNPLMIKKLVHLRFVWMDIMS